MERLTDRELAKALKSNCEGLKRAGIEPNMSDLRYIKLAEYENREERARSDFYLTCYPFPAEIKLNEVTSEGNLYKRYNVFVAAKNKEKALKIARDKLTEYKARELGI